jgi:dimethylhistidine N-methyltransferase
MKEQTNTDMNKLVVLEGKKLEMNFAQDVLKGLSAMPKSIPSKYFYDDRGSKLFEEIMKLEEYYPTNCEWQIFRSHKQEILEALEGEPFSLVDLGAGDAEKTKVLLHHFVKAKADFNYAPIDISKDILEKLLSDLEEELPSLETQAVVAEYFDALDWLSKNHSRRKLVLFMGGNIGNFPKEAATDFLKKMHDVLAPNDLLLIGIDLKKEPKKIVRAYDDSKGVTAEFNYNLLTRINNELGGNFNLDQWHHYASYNPVTGAMESFLVSMQDQEVFISELNKRFSFEAFEAVHTEYSYKYTYKEVSAMAEGSGFELLNNYGCDVPFIDSLWRVRK